MGFYESFLCKAKILCRTTLTLSNKIFGGFSEMSAVLENFPVIQKVPSNFPFPFFTFEYRTYFSPNRNTSIPVVLS